ncbi:MAG: glycosyltransferase family 4 protein [Parcubacteria group bacterium]|nr:glycosyltransferase family 4 protein [Parcubacteria group bacterium]
MPRFHLNLRMRVKALQDAGHHVSVLALRSLNGLEDYDVVSPYVVEEGCVSQAIRHIFSNVFGREFTEKIMYIWSVPRIRSVIYFLQKVRPDMIFVRGQKNMFTVTMSFSARLLCRNVYLLAQTERYCGDTLSKRVTLFVLKYIIRVRGIISPLENICSQAHSLYVYIPFATSVPERIRYISKSGPLRILAVGKFQKRKDFLLLLRAYKELLVRYDITLTLVGSSYDEEYEHEIVEYIREHIPSDAVSVLRDVPHVDMEEIFLQHDIFVLPSYAEPAAYTPLEAMAHGLPVIVSDTCGTKCYIEEGENGYIFKSKDVISLKRALEQCLGNRQHCVNMGRCARKKAETHHTTTVFAKHIEVVVCERNI